MDFLSAPLDLITKPISAIAKTATGALGGVLQPLTSTATQLAGAVTAPLTHAMDSATSLGQAGIQTYGATMQGVTQAMGNTVQGVAQYGSRGELNLTLRFNSPHISPEQGRFSKIWALYPQSRL